MKKKTKTSRKNKNKKTKITKSFSLFAGLFFAVSLLFLAQGVSAEIQNITLTFPDAGMTINGTITVNFWVQGAGWMDFYYSVNGCNGPWIYYDRVHSPSSGNSDLVKAEYSWDTLKLNDSANVCLKLNSTNPQLGEVFDILGGIFTVRNYCGDGIITAVKGETCDDNNIVNSDGCSSVCKIETGWECHGAPSSCVLVCGNGVVDSSAGEQCDGGDCCDIDCTFKSSSDVCREASGVCDATETCTGLSANCPIDLKSTSECRASSGVCDVAETCDGVNNDCPVDGFAGFGTSCDDGLFCTVDDFCDGSGSCSLSFPRSCTDYDLSAFGECSDDPFFFWVQRNPFTSFCNETLDVCPTGDTTVYMNCNLTCGAECEENNDCSSTACSTELSGCYNNIYRTYSDIANTCNLETCGCSNNVCDVDSGYVSETDNDNDGYSSSCGDSNDEDNSTYPGAPELCDNKDNNLNGDVDESLVRADDNLNGECSANTETCITGNWLDTETNYLPVDETCNTLDDNCNSEVDEELGTLPADNILGKCENNVKVCSGGSWVDSGDNYSPVDETCNGLDDNCNDFTDEDVKTTFYQDADSDLFGSALVSQEACSAPEGYVTDNTDCNDESSAINPSATEICNGLDDNCNSFTDEDENILSTADFIPMRVYDFMTQTCYTGADGTNNVGECHSGLQTCSTGEWGTCVDEVTPTQEICDGLDNNCDGNVDEDVKTIFYEDLDGDGYGNNLVSVQACSAPEGYVADNLDCNDDDARKNLDCVAPVIVLNGEDVINVTVGNNYTELGALVTDNIDLSLTAVITGTVDTNVVGTYTVYYDATDSSGNNALQVTRTVNVNAAPEQNNDGGGRGGGGGCATKWNCTAWNACSSSGTQTRTCSYPANFCTPREAKPSETQTCTYTPSGTTNQTLPQTPDNTPGGLNTTAPTGFFNRITGAVIGGGVGSWIAAIIFILLIGGLLWWVLGKKKPVA